MRVVAGTAGGRRLVTPDGRDTRPTGDRVREAAFNALGSLGAVVGAVVVDLFAGSGALGIEALSRGAASAHFVESDRRALDAIRANLDALDLSGSATVVARDVDAAIALLPARIDLVLADPPYAFTAWGDLLARLAPRLDADAVVVVESDRSLDLPSGWEKVRERTYGGTVVLFARPPGVPETAGADDPTGADA